LTDKQGRTALDLALKYNHFTVADFLRSRGVPHAGDHDQDAGVSGRGFYSFTFQLNLGAFYGIRGARRGCGAHVERVFRECRVFSCVGHGSS